MDDLRCATESLVYAWQALSSSLWSNRLMGDMTFNEINVCSFLKKHPHADITATDLCEATGLKKSQMNRLLSDMEAQGYLLRERSDTDRRLVFLRLLPQGEAAYMHEREAIMCKVDHVVEVFGRDNALLTAQKVNELSHVLRDLMQPKG